MTSNGRVARLTALALATGTLVAAGSTAANAATTTKDVFTAGNISAAETVLGKDTVGNGVIRLVLNLPTGVPGLLPKHIIQDIVVTKSNTRSGEAPDAISSAVLGENGNVPLLSQLLSGGQTASLNGSPQTTPNAGLGSALGSLGLLNFKSTVANPNTVGTIAHSTSSIADVHIGDASVLNSILGPLQSAINTALGSLKLAPSASAGAGQTATVTNVVNTLVGTLNQATNNVAAADTSKVQDAVAQITSLLNGLLAQLGSQLDLKTALDTDKGLINVGLIKSEETVTRSAAGVVTSTNDNRLADISLLGGLVKGSALTSTARAALDANGNPVNLGTAATNGDLLSLNVADVLVARVTDQIKVILGGTVGSAIPADALDAVNQLLSTLTALTQDLLGFSFKPGAAGKSTFAHNDSEQSAAAAVLTLDPPLLHSLIGAPLLQASFVPATASVVHAQSVVAPTVVQSLPRSLPRTGANLPLTGTAAAVLMGLAMVARRRRLAHVEG